MTTTKSKVALITGAARRVGAEISKTLHQQGYKVLIHYHQSAAEAIALAAQLNQQRNHSALALQGDFNEFQSYQSIIEQGGNHWGRLDVLVNNASQFFPTPPGNTTEQQWHTLFNTNAKYAFFLSEAAMPWLKQSQGNIINITDIYASFPLKHYSVYSMAKASLRMMTQALALDYAPEIRVNAVAPGVTIWPEGDNHLSDDDKQKVLAKIPLQHMGKPELIANAILFLLNTDHITGQTITLDGGRSVSF